MGPSASSIRISRTRIDAAQPQPVCTSPRLAQKIAGAQPLAVICKEGRLLTGSFFGRRGGKGIGGVPRRRMTLMLLSPRGAPAFAMFANPVEQSPLESDVVTKPLRFNPFVFQDFFTFSEELLIETGLFYELAGRRRL